MKVLRQRKYLFALLALLVVFTACKGESPTAPTPTGGTSGGGGTVGGTTPPVGATITLTVSNATPLVNSTSVVSATVTLNGNPVPNGTAVEFDTTLGTWQDNGSAVTIRTTTNGVATATLTSPSAGTAKVTAIVNNVSRTTNVAFQTTPVTPPSTPTAPTVTAVAPTSGLAAGGETITITGTNFRTPVRVLFDLGGGVVKEGFVANVTPTQLTVVTPHVNLGSGQTLPATIIVINEAGTTSEARVTASAPFTFRVAQLTPVVATVSPDSGPIGGGTRITIFGSGFEAPVQVSFGKGGTFNQMQVISITFSQIIALTPTARDVNPDGSGPLTGPVDLRVVNINSNTSVTLSNAFRYTPKAQITAITPGFGSAFGGTRVTVDGTGFDPPVTISFGGIVAQPIQVSGTQIIAITGPTPSPCKPPALPTQEVNINNGDGATGPVFSYLPEIPQITAITPNVAPAGSTITVTVVKPGVGAQGNANIRFTLNNKTVFATPGNITDPFGPTAFVMTVPTPATFPSIACTVSPGVAGTKLDNIISDVVFTNVTTGCTDTVTSGLTITPVGPNPCTAPPVAPAPSAVVNPPSFCPNGFLPASVGAAGSTSQVLTIRNAAASGAQALTFTTAVTGANAGDFTVSPGTGSVAAGSLVPVTITFKPTAVGVRNATLNIFTNDPANLTFAVCLQGTGTP